MKTPIYVGLILIASAIKPGFAYDNMEVIICFFIASVIGDILTIAHKNEIENHLKNKENEKDN